MDESLVGFPGFKPVREALTLSWVGSIPTRLRHSGAAARAAAMCGALLRRRLLLRRFCPCYEVAQWRMPTAAAASV